MKSILKKTLIISLVLLSSNLKAAGGSENTATVKNFDRPVTDLHQVSVDRKKLLGDLNSQKKSLSTDYSNFDVSHKKYFEALKKNNGGWGGGTGVIRLTQGSILYDLYMSDPDYVDSYEITPNLADTAFFQKTGYEYVQVENLAEYEAVIKLLERWRPKANGLVSLLIESLKNLKLSYTSMPLQRIDGLVLVEPLRDGDRVEPVIIFNPVIGARINRTLWNQLGDRSRIAALIHEALRNYQIALHLHTRESDFDAKIQRITNLLVMQNPQEISGFLDYTQFFDAAMLEYLESLESNHLTFREMIEIYHPHYLSDPATQKKMIESFSNPIILADWEARKKKNLTESSPFKIQNDLNSVLIPEPEIAKFKQMEQSVRHFLQSTPVNRSEIFQREVEIKALRLLNDYLQTRWLDEAWYGLWSDVQKLISLQLRFPREDIFGNIKKYQEMLMTNFSMPIDKIQGRDVTQFEEEKAKLKVIRRNWIEGLRRPAP